jgi:Protein of unknown function, DUF547
MKKTLSLIIAFVATILPTLALDHSHASFDGTLKKYVKPTGVDYAKLKGDISPLKSYLDSLAAVTESEFKKFNKEEQMAMLINLYNAATLNLIVENYPVKSIKDIAKSSGGPWKQSVVRLHGKSISLDSLENDLLRPKYKDPRIHFAINCASIGCPILRSEAFQSKKLSAQMDEQTELFLADRTKNRIDAKSKTLQLSSIFDWFKGDFVDKSGSVEKFIAPYCNDSDRALIEAGGWKITYMEYSWSLNEQ